MNDKYEEIFQMERELQGAKATVAFQTAGVPLYRKAQMKKDVERAQAKLFQAIDALTLDEMAEYGEYRKKAIEETREIAKRQ